MADTKDLHERYFPLSEKSHPQIYAYSLDSSPNEIKVGFTTKADVRDRINEQLKTSNQSYRLLYYADAIKNTGDTFDDRAVHKWLIDHGATRVPYKEQFKTTIGRRPEIFTDCTEKDVEAAVKSIITGKDYSANRTNDYSLRTEQREAIDKTKAYFTKQKIAEPSKVPKFLWNAKMRFGKSYTALSLAKEMDMKRILIISFKVEIKDSWKNEVNTHIDFDGWQFIDIKEKNAAESIDKTRPYVVFGSFQDLLGKNPLGGIKVKNEWVHTDNWDMVIIDEYHFGAWRDKSKGLLLMDREDEDMALLDDNDLPITTEYILYLSGTPFRAINTGEFLEDQLYNWTYNMEQEAKNNWDSSKGENPYLPMPEMILMTYQLPEACTQIALKGEQDEFDLNEFFRAEIPEGKDAKDAIFVHKNEVQRWLDIIRGKAEISNEIEKSMGATKPVLPYFDTSLEKMINHTLWYMHSIASCHAMKNLLNEPQNSFYKDYEVIVAAGSSAGSGEKALIPVREAMKNPLTTKTITITCGKLTTGITVRPWSAIFMLTSISTPEAYFQSSFRVQSAWTVKSDEADVPDEIIKPKCYIFDFAPNRALRQLSEYACSLNPDITSSDEEKVAEFIKFLPVLAFDGTGMYPINAVQILDYVASGTTATLLAKKWDSALLVNVANETIQKIIDDKEAYDAIMQIEGFRNMNSDIFETIINRSKEIKETKSKGDTNSDAENKRDKKEITEKEKEIKSKRKMIQECLRKFATRIPLFMYLTDEREICLKDVITKVEPALFKKVTGIKVSEFDRLVEIGVFNSSAMNEAVAAFRRYEESSLSYTGIDKHYGEKVGLWDVSVRTDELQSL